MLRASFDIVLQVKQYKKLICISLCLFFFPSFPLFARVPTVSNLLYKIQEQNTLPRRKTGLFLKTNVTVYEFSQQQESKVEEQTIGTGLPKKDFTQQITWIQNKFLAITNVLPKQRKTGVFLLQHNKYYSSKNNPFQVEDSLYHYLFFLQPNEYRLQKALEQLGISPIQVKLVLFDGKYQYKIGLSDQYIIVEPGSLHVVALVRSLLLNGKNYEYKIAFSHWKQYLPKVTNYYLDNTLIKTVTLRSYTTSGLASREQAFLRKYKKNLIPIEYE